MNPRIILIACVVAAAVSGGSFPSSADTKTFHRGSREYDPAQLGYSDDGAYVFDASSSGNSNAGHDYGTKLSGAEKQDLMEYPKTL